MLFHTKLSFIYFTTNLEMPRIMKRLLSRGKNWSVITSNEVDETTKLLQRGADILLIGPGASPSLIETWHTIAGDSNTTVIEHYGGGSGLLYNEIQEYLDHLKHS